MDGKNAKVESFRILIETQWNTLKENAVLVFFGVVLFAGAMAVFVGAHCTRRRNVEVPTMRGSTEEHRPCNSELFAEKSDLHNIHGSTGEEIGKEKLELEKLDEKRDNNTTQGVCCRREAGSDDAYSSVYNVLQPNYGTERCRPQQ
uniref:Uncharacterized protein LOC111108570 n=1 Tax=Crassostrea virginica TaxID=6565 RepID=A0A8B8BBY1_CRAVI|nr:uncharacterized protein LOC111108570 [Crassostrea virginica]